MSCRCLFEMVYFVETVFMNSSFVTIVNKDRKERFTHYLHKIKCVERIDESFLS